jgi:hypothetical protein
MSPNSDKENIFNAVDCPSDETLFDYAHQKLGMKEMRSVELHLADCEMCSDAVDGMMLAPGKDVFKNDIAEINTRLTHLLEQKNKKVIPLSRTYVYAIAASLLLIIGIGILFNYFVGDTKEKEMAVLEKSKKNTETISHSETSSIIESENNKVQEPDNSESDALNLSNNHQPIEKKSESSEPKKRLDNTTDYSASKSIDANLSSGKAVFVETAATKDEAGSITGVAETKSLDDDLQRDAEPSSTESITFSGQAAPAVAQVQTTSTDKSKSSKVRSVNESDDKGMSALEDAKNDFSKGLYKAANSKLQKILKNEPANEEAIFLQAKSKRILKEYASSIALFDKILTLKTSPYIEEAQWQKALNLVDLKEKKAALELLNKIAEGKGKYAYPAAEMRTELDEK